MDKQAVINKEQVKNWRISLSSCEFRKQEPIITNMANLFDMKVSDSQAIGMNE